MLKLLVSVVNRIEALEAVKGGAHIVDVKNPEEGSLGANFPDVIKRVRQVVSDFVEVSATIGDLPNLPGTASLAALGAAASGADYVKAGLYGLKTIDEAVYLMREVSKAVKGYKASVKVIAAGYADSQKIASLNPLTLPEVARKSDSGGVMIDTKLKHGGKSFAYIPQQKLAKFVIESHDYGLLAAIAGSLDRNDISTVHQLGFDVVGVRKAVCQDSDRLRGQVLGTLVQDLTSVIRGLDPRL